MSFDLTAKVVNEADIAGLLVGWLSAESGRAPYERYELVSGAGSDHNDLFSLEAVVFAQDNERFALVLAEPVDYETTPELQIRIRATEADGSKPEQSFVIAVRDLQDPVILTPLPHQRLDWSERQLAIDLASSFDDPCTTGEFARFKFSDALVQRLAPVDPVLQVLLQERPWIDVLLFNQAGLGAPLSTSNLKAYINSGRYVDTFIHRSMPGFVIQGGGYTWAESVEPEVATTSLLPVAADAPVLNEYSSERANIRGTVAMAKLGNDPNSATSQWFFSLADNVANLDRQNGGFTVFGRVQSADDLLLMDMLSAVDVYNAGGVFSDIPLLLDPGASVSAANTVRFSDVELHDRPELTYTATTSSPLLEASVQDQRLLLRLHPSAKPSAETVVVRVVAINLLGESLQQEFQVQLPTLSPALVSTVGDVLLAEAASEVELQNPEVIKGSGWIDVITLNAPRSLTFRAVAHERWGAGYVARNAATGQFLPLLGLGRYSFVAQNISPEGSSLSIELDESKPSALFLHDAHSAFHAQLVDRFLVDSDGRESLARLEKIDAIVMGGFIGTSIVDLTSADYSLDAVAVHGGSRSGSRSVIWCGDGNDTVIGHGADLVIFGGDGANAYQLSGGQDVLQFAADGHSNDRVASFDPGSDRIEIWNAQALQDPISFTSQADGLLLKWGNSSLLLEGLTSTTIEDLMIRYHD